MNTEEPPTSASKSKSSVKSTPARKSDGFKENYAVLKETADWLSEQSSAGDEPDIDALVPRVEAAMKAYQACKERLDAVEAQLSSHLDGAQNASPSSTGD